MDRIGKTLVGLILINILFSLYIGLTAGTDNYFCDVGAGCDIVQNSPYASIFGMKLAWFGVGSFVLLLIAFLLLREKHYYIFFSMSVLGFIFAIYFVYLQIFVIGALCQNCLVIDIIAMLIFFISSFEINKKIMLKK